MVKDNPSRGDHPWVIPAEGVWTLGVAQPGPMPGKRSLIKRSPVHWLPLEAEVAVAAPWRSTQHGGGGGGGGGRRATA